MKKTIYLTVLSLITVFCIIAGSIYHISGWIGFGLDNFFNFISDNGSSISRSYDQETYAKDLDTFSKIKIDTDVMNINVKEGNTFHIEYDSPENRKPEFNVSDSTLEVKQQSARGWLRNHINYKCDMTITIPSGTVLDSADITTDVGNIHLDNIECKDFKLESDVGNVDIKSCTFNYSEIESDVGNIEAASSDLGNSNIETDTGDIDITTCAFKNIDIYNDIGNVGLESSKINTSDYTIDLSTDVGSVKYKGEKHKKSFYQAASGSPETYKITIETDIGNISFD